MGYFNYHNRLKQLLNTEKYICVPENILLLIDLFFQDY